MAMTKEERAAYMKAYRAKNKAKAAGANKKHYEANKEEVKEKSKEAGKKKLKEETPEQRAARLEKMRAYNKLVTQRRRAAKAAKAVPKPEPVPKSAPAPKPVEDADKKKAEADAEAKARADAADLEGRKREEEVRTKVKVDGRTLAAKKRKEAKRQEGINDLKKMVIDQVFGDRRVTEASMGYFQKRSRELGLPKSFYADVSAEERARRNAPRPTAEEAGVLMSKQDAEIARVAEEAPKVEAPKVEATKVEAPKEDDPGEVDEDFNRLIGFTPERNVGRARAMLAAGGGGRMLPMMSGFRRR